LKLGIMQGRLVPPEAQRFQCFPRQRWRDEFALAAAAGLDAFFAMIVFPDDATKI